MLPKWVSMPVIYGLIGLCITLGGVAGLQTYRVSLAHEETAKTTSALDKAKAEIAEEREQFATKARQSERAHAERLAAQRTENQGRLDRAISQERAVADGLRADNLRLQRRWTGCEAATA